MVSDNPVVLATITHSEHLTDFFNRIGERGYDLEQFPVSEQEALKQRAKEVSDSGTPVAVICSQRMTLSPFTAPHNEDKYAGEEDGHQFAKSLGAICTSPNLTIIYSTAVFGDNLSALDAETDSPVLEVDKLNSERRLTEDADFICDAMDRFFARHHE